MKAKRIRYLDVLLAALGLAGKVRRGGAPDIGRGDPVLDFLEGPYARVRAFLGSELRRPPVARHVARVHLPRFTVLL